MARIKFGFRKINKTNGHRIAMKIIIAVRKLEKIALEKERTKPLKELAEATIGYGKKRSRRMGELHKRRHLKRVKEVSKPKVRVLGSPFFF